MPISLAERALACDSDDVPSCDSEHRPWEPPVNKLRFVALVGLFVVAPVLVLAFAPAPDADSRSVEYKTWNGYAESRESGLKGEISVLAFTDRTAFQRTFDPVLTGRGLP